MSNRLINFNPLWIKLAADFKRDKVVKLNDVLELLSEERDIPDVAREVLSALIQGKGRRKSNKLTYQKEVKLIDDYSKILYGHTEYEFRQLDDGRTKLEAECRRVVAEQYKISADTVENILEEQHFLTSVGKATYCKENKP